MGITCSAMVDLASSSKTNEEKGTGLTHNLTPRDRGEFDLVALARESFPHQFPVEIYRSLAFSAPRSPLVHPRNHLKLTTHPLIISRSSLALSHYAGLTKEKL